MRILFADRFPDHQRQQLASAGHLCTYAPEVITEQLPTLIDDHEALVVRSTRVTDEVYAAGDSLRLVVRAGAGVNTIDCEAAKQRGIIVCNVPAKNAIAVAELTMGLLIAIDRHIADNVIDLRAGQWNKKGFSVADGLYGKSIGIIGAGAVGLEVAKRAYAFGLRLVTIDHPVYVTADARKQLDALGTHYVDDLYALAQSVDIVSVHVPLTPETRYMLDARFFSYMRRGSIVLNTARGGIIDERALLEVLNSKNIRAGLDVYEHEPEAGKGEYHGAIGKHPNVYGTHHIGASTAQSQAAVADGVCDVINAYLRGAPINRVN